MKKTALWILGILFVLLPFHPFLSTFFNEIIFPEYPLVQTIVKAWKEILIVTLSVIVGMHVYQKKEKLVFDHLDAAILLFIFLSFLTGIFFTGAGFPENILQIIWGAKYAILFLLFFFIVRHIIFSDEEKSLLLQLALGSATVTIAFGIAQATILPENFLTKFGYNAEYGVTETVQGNTISYCHKIENSITHEEFCRIQSTFSGPNQFAAFLLFVLPLFFFRAMNSKTNLQTLLNFLFFLSGGIVLMLTWGRAAWIGAIAAATAYFILQAKKPLHAFAYLSIFGFGVVSLFFPALFMEYWDELKIISLFMSAICLLGIIFLYGKNLQEKHFSPIGSIFFPMALSLLFLVRAVYDAFFWNIILRPSSSQGHWERWTDGAKYIAENPLGLGLGDAGPASARFASPGETGFLPESWYLQVGLESGILGLFLFLCILFFLAKKLLESKDPDAQPLLLGFVGISTASLFLHSWEAAPVALSFWGFAAIILAPEKKKSFWEKLRKIFS